MSSSSIGKRRKGQPTPPADLQAEGRSESLINSVLSGGGEMGALMRAFDWSRSPLGPVSQWPQSLRIAVRILLGTGYPMLICWGSQYTMIYNDGYRPILGKTKHPGALGSPIQTVFTEAMDFIGPRFDRVMAQGQDFTVTDQLFILDRNDYVEECYFTFSYSPAPGDDGSVGGVLVTALETTERVLDDRRRRTLRDLATEMAKTHTEQELWQAAAATLVSEPLTVPFVALYAYESAERRAHLVASAGGTSHAMRPPTLDLHASAVWPLAQVNESEVLVTDLAERFPDIPSTSWGIPPSRAVIVPLAIREHQDSAGFLIAGISPRREFDQPYRLFFRRSAEQIATALAGARAYEQQRRRAEALAELDRAKTLFFSNVSHEFRTPLTLMLGPLEELMAKSRNRIGEEEHQQVEVARRNALRLLKLVNTLLDFSRIEAGRVQAVYEPTDLAKFTSEIASSFRSAMEKAGLRFSVECESISEPVNVDRDMWEKVVLNLLSNAFKFTFEGEVVLTLKQLNGAVELAVRDTGIGIAEEEQGRVFERFHRIENTRARTYEGTGIGLALVQELVKLHGGTVQVSSAPGQGSTFTVSIPRGTAHLPADRVGATRTLASTALVPDAYIDEAQRWVPDRTDSGIDQTFVSGRPGDKTERQLPEAQRDVIVIADDNADMRDYLGHLLRDQYAVYTVSDGAQALDATRKLGPALVLADVMMPGLDGFGLLSAIRADERLRSTPVILLSARAGEESRVEGLQGGADDYLVKPFTARELIARVATHVRMAHIRREAAERESRLRAEAELERRRLQELLAQAPAAIGLLNGPDHRWVYVNDDYVRLTGRNSPADFLGKTVSESLPEIETQVFVGLLDDVYRTGKPYFGREMKAILNRSAKGLPDESYWDFVYQPVRDADGNVEGILVHAVEVTDKVTAKRAIEQSEKKYRDFAETAAIALHWVGPDGTILWANQAELDMLGYTAEEYIGRNITEFHADVPVICDILDRLSRGDKLREYEARLRAKDGTLRHVVIDSSVLFENGKFVHTRCFTRDVTQRKLAEQALRESEQKLRVVTEATPILIWMSGTDKLCYYFNKSWLDFVGRTLEQEKGNGWTENVHPEDFDRCLQIYVACFDARQPFEMEYRLRHHGGEYRWILDHGVPRYAPDGTFEGYVGGCLDIHDQKEAAEKVRVASEALHASEERLRLAQQAAGIGTFELNLQTNVNRWTPEMEAMYGLNPGAFKGTQEHWEQLIHPDDKPTALKQVEVGLQTGAPVQAEWRVIWPDGSVHWILGRWQVFKDDSGKPLRMAGINIDVTKQKAAEEARRRLAAIVESSDDAIVSKDLNGIITSWNRQAERLFGYTEAEMVGRSILTIIPPELHRDEDMILSKIRSGQKMDHFETVRIAKSGERIEVSLSISPVRDELGNIVGAAKIARDIRESRKIERTLRTTEKLAAAGRLAATVAHEINNPLEAVTNLVYLAKRDLPADAAAAAAHLNLAKRELDRVAHIAKQTLGFYRDTSSPVRFNVAEAVDDLLTLYERRLETRNIRIAKKYDRSVEVVGLAGEIRQALSNLLTNSMDAMPAGGTLSIRVRKTHEWSNAHHPGVRITIADTGSGIASADRRNLFQPFFTTKSDVGTGLGLWITRGIVEKHGGIIQVKSKTGEKDHGTTFSILLPAEGRIAAAPLRQTAAKGKILAGASVQ